MNRAQLQSVLGVGTRQTAAVVHQAGSKIEKVPIDLIDGDPHQPRRTFDDLQLAELRASLEQHGQLAPIRIRRAPTGRYIVIAGERRLRAARLAGWSTIEAIVLDERVSMDRVRVESVVENLQRADLTPLETAQAYRRLQESWGVSQAELARRLGVSTATVSRGLALLQAPAETRAKLEAGESVRQAVAATPRRKPRATKTDKRRAVEIELRSGFVRVKRGATLEQLLEELRAVAAGEQGEADQSQAA